MAEILAALTERHQSLLNDWGQDLQAASGWCGSLPVAILDRCWLRLRRVPVERLAVVLPPDASADAPELVRYRNWIAAGEPSWRAEVRCWQEFGQPACQEAQRYFWSHQDSGNHGWTLEAYLGLLDTYRKQLRLGGQRCLPLLVLARSGQLETHSLHWLTPLGQAMRHTCP
ncbi:MAG: hypothetical protein WD136_08150 [Cyanobium sp.]